VRSYRLYSVLILSVVCGFSVSTFSSEDFPVGTRYNEVRQISSHNSYDIDGIKPGLKEQADQGVRSFELDMHKSLWSGGGNYPHSDWGIYHTSVIQSAGDHCQTLKGCLIQLKDWHDQHPDHEIITLWLQMGKKLDGSEDMWETGGHFPVDLDNRRLEKDLAGMLYTPVKLLQRCTQATNIQEAVKICGWPTLSELAGKFLVVLQGNNQAAQNYLHHVNSYHGDPNVGKEGYQGNKVSFVAFDITNGQETNQHPDAVFFNLEKTNVSEAKKIYENKFVSRVWEIKNQSEWNNARKNYVHHLCTDHVSVDLFVPRAVDANGEPFEVMGNLNSL
jgi:hypothetical protein